MDLEEQMPESEPWYKGPMRIILGVVLILLLIVWYFPTQSVKLDPSPDRIPSLDEVVPQDIEITTRALDWPDRRSYPALVNASDPLIKQTADRIVTSACDGSRVCYAKAIFGFVQSNFAYVSDPASFEYVKSARESLATTGGDCDDASVLLANLLEAVGIPTRFVFIPGHVYVQAYLPDALRRYKTESTDWVSLDATCSNCAFGELPYSDLTDQKTIVQ